MWESTHICWANHLYPTNFFADSIKLIEQEKYFLKNDYFYLKYEG